MERWKSDPIENRHFLSDKEKPAAQSLVKL